MMASDKDKDKKKDKKDKKGKKEKRVIQPKPVPGLPITQRTENGKDRPSLGTGQAEKAARELEGRRSRVDQAVQSMVKRTGADKKRNK